MAMGIYLPMHPEAKLTKDEQAQLIDWAKKLREDYSK